MRTIAEQLQLIKATKKIGLMTHVVAGYPSLRETEELVLSMQEEGVDFVEIQIPFSDPLADGPVIMKANDQALRNGVKIDDAFALMKRLSKKVEIPLFFMGYFNTVFRYGVERFCQTAEQVGCKGLIIPDMPFDEDTYDKFSFFCNKHNLANIRVLSPSSTPERISGNEHVATGFVYCTARTGVTGAETSLSTKTQAYLSQVKEKINLPIAVGFGIHSAEQIRALEGYADIAVVGSAVIQVLTEKGIVGVKKYIRSLHHSPA
jgi:tryptophan synthase alpha chain